LVLDRIFGVNISLNANPYLRPNTKVKDLSTLQKFVMQIRSRSKVLLIFSLKSFVL